MAYTNLGSKVYFSPTPRPTEMTQLDFEAIDDWEDLGCVGDVSEIGSTGNIVSYECWGTGEAKKSKGIRDYGDVTIEMLYDAENEGQDSLREAETTNFNYALKIEYGDAPDEDHTGTVLYVRGPVSGWSIPNGGPEDFQVRSVTIGVNQRPIEVKPEEIE